MTSIADALAEAYQRLAACGVETPRLDAEVLLAHIIGQPRLDMLVARELVLTEVQLKTFAELLRLRETHKPVCQIIGVKEFWSLDFEVSSAVLAPRADSETLVSEVIKYLPKNESAKLLDLGVGSGCLALSILTERPLLRAVGVDISREALTIAKRNRVRHKLKARLELVCGDLFSPLNAEQNFDIILSNPPYIETGEIPTLAPEVAQFEPTQALDGGVDGLDFYRRIVKESPVYLKPGGLLAMEIGWTQAKDVQELLGAEWENTQLIPDLEGRDRVILAYLKK